MTLDQSGEDMEPKPSTSVPSTSGATVPSRGLVSDRFQQGTVVTIVPQKSKRTHELQLPAMSLLTAKSSSQRFFLRLLKVIIQLSTASPAKASGARPDIAARRRQPASSIANTSEAVRAAAESVRAAAESLSAATASVGRTTEEARAVAEEVRALAEEARAAAAETSSFAAAAAEVTAEQSGDQQEQSESTSTAGKI